MKIIWLNITRLSAICLLGIFIYDVLNDLLEILKAVSHGI